jgi:hypothetical protein
MSARSFTTPVGTVLFSHLKVPSTFAREGKKPDTFYDVVLSLDPTKNQEDKDFLDLLLSMETAASDGEGATYTTMKPRKTKNKETGELTNHPSEIQVRFKAKMPPEVRESGQLVTGDNLQVPFGSKATIDFEAKPYNFTPDGGNTIKGVSLTMMKVTIEKRPGKTNKAFSR